jgi:hypothetical protein
VFPNVAQHGVPASIIDKYIREYLFKYIAVNMLGCVVDLKFATPTRNATAVSNVASAFDYCFTGAYEILHAHVRNFCPCGNAKRRFESKPRYSSSQENTTSMLEIARLSHATLREARDKFQRIIDGRLMS